MFDRLSDRIKGFTFILWDKMRVYWCNALLPCLGWFRSSFCWSELFFFFWRAWTIPRQRVKVKAWLFLVCPVSVRAIVASLIFVNWLCTFLFSLYFTFFLFFISVLRKVYRGGVSRCLTGFTLSVVLIVWPYFTRVCVWVLSVLCVCVCELRVTAGHLPPLSFLVYLYYVVSIFFIYWSVVKCLFFSFVDTWIFSPWW